MKRILSILSLIVFVGIYSSNAQCCATPCAAQAGTKANCAQTKSDSPVKAYYFHATQRCATCMAVEDVTKEALKEYYGDKIAFVSINSEKDAKNPLIKKYKVSGQTLIIVKGDQVTNLTNDAFLNARTKPEKLKEKIKATIDPII